MKNKKANLIIPIAGRGQRFVDAGYKMPKPLVMVDGKHIIDWSMSSIDVTEYNITFIIRQDHIDSFGLDKILKDKFGVDINIVITNEITRGTVESCLLATNFINNDTPLVIYTLDVHFQPKFKISDVDPNIDGFILTFKANSPSYSYIRLNDEGYACKTAEKSVISENAAVGIYYFARGSMFVKYAQQMIRHNIHTNGEFYVCPVYNLMIEDKKLITTKPVDKMYLMGTPEELNFFKYAINRQFGKTPLALCSDHSGLNLKESTKKILSELGYSFIDFGTYTNIDCDYHDYVSQVVEFINDGFCDYGFVFCRSGQGVNIASNKHSGIRSALIYDAFAAEMAVRHNCANIFAFSEKYTDEEQMKKYINIIANNTFDGGRHQVRLQKIK